MDCRSHEDGITQIYGSKLNRFIFRKKYITEDSIRNYIKENVEIREKENYQVLQKS